MNGQHLPSPVKETNTDDDKQMTTSKVIVHGFAWKRIGIFLKLGLPGERLYQPLTTVLWLLQTTICVKAVCLLIKVK